MTGTIETSLPLLKLRKMARRYGSFVANDGIDLCLQPSEIHDILGEIGTGKSTLMNTNFGVHHPDEGTILWNWQDTGRHVAVKLCM